MWWISPCNTILNEKNSPLSFLNQVIENCPVTGIQVRTDDFGVKRVKAVETPHGTIETPCVVNCAGEFQLTNHSEDYNVKDLMYFSII